MTLSTKLDVPEGHSLHHVVCPHDCPDTCSMLVTRDDHSGRAVQVQGDPTHPVTRGYLCNRVNHYLDLVCNLDLGDVVVPDFEHEQHHRAGGIRAGWAVAHAESVQHFIHKKARASTTEVAATRPN